MEHPIADRFENTLDECLERLLQGESVEQVLARYPKQAAELEPLLRVAANARKASAIDPRPEFKARVRYQVQSSLQTNKQKAQPKRPPLSAWVPRWALVMAAVFLVIVLAGTRTVAASTSSMPGDTLFPVKQATEHVQQRLTHSNMGKARLQARFADNRVSEIARLANKGNDKGVEKTTSQLVAQMQEIQARIEADKGKPGSEKAISKLKDILQARAASNEALLLQARGNVRDPVVVDRAIDRLRQGYDAAIAAAGESPSRSSPTTPESWPRLPSDSGAQ